ncbi:hypothetical protein ACFGVS_02855 [Mucilaginibacter sp. AW1-7]|uniref:hypothetical protein n=1 Tax=Mucilaginibacter sp. AW1-7 TaxID=3349874 RepID=UPI003F73FDB4
MEELNEKQKPQQRPKIIIIGINLAVLAAYTIYFGVNKEELIIIGEAFFIAVQIIICLIAAIFVYRKEFLLSALVVLLIGFSTCLAVFSS